MKSIPMELKIDVIKFIPIETCAKNVKILLVCNFLSTKLIIAYFTKLKKIVGFIIFKFHSYFFVHISGRRGC